MKMIYAAVMCLSALIPPQLGWGDVVFEPNRGQLDSRIHFVSRGAEYTFAVGQGEAFVHAPAANGQGGSIRLDFVGSNLAAEGSGLDPTAARSHYIIGADPSRWCSNVPRYASVEVAELYPGVGLRAFESDSRVEFDLVLEPGADPDSVAIAVDGALSVSVDSTGALVMALPGGAVRLEAPVVYQLRDSRRSLVDARYVLDSSSSRPIARIDVGHYDVAQALVIDPVITWARFLGGDGLDTANSVVFDQAGFTYVSGSTVSVDFPLVFGASIDPAQDTAAGSHDAFVTKLDRNGLTLYSTYFGGSGPDIPRGIGVAPDGSVTVAGTTDSLDFPTAQAAQGAFGGGAGDAFVFSLNPGGTAPVYSTYWGGAGEDEARGIGVAADGVAVIAGFSKSSDFPTTNALFPSDPGGTNAGFAAWFAPDGAVVSSTYFGGEGFDSFRAISVGSDGFAVAVGETTSCDNDSTPAEDEGIPLNNPAQTECETSIGANGMVVRFAPAGSSIVHSTYVHGVFGVPLSGVAALDDGSAVVCSGTTSPGFPVVNAFQNDGAGARDLLVAKLGPNGGSYEYATYLGGTDIEGNVRCAVAATAAGQAIVITETESTDIPVELPPEAVGGDSLLGVADAYVAQLSADGGTLEFARYLGGTASEPFRGDVAVGPSGRIAVVGQTSSADFPVIQFESLAKSENVDVFVGHLVAPGPLSEIVQSLPVVTPGELIGTDDPASLQFSFRNEGPDVARDVVFAFRVLSATGTADFSIEGVQAVVSGLALDTEAICEVTEGEVVTCQLGEFAPSTEGDAPNLVRISMITEGTGLLTMVGSFAAADADTNRLDSVRTLSVQIADPVVDLALSGAATNDTVAVGNAAEYTFAVTNTEDEDTSPGASFSFLLVPEDLANVTEFTIESFTTTSGTCEQVGVGKVVCELASTAPGSSAAVSVTVVPGLGGPFSVVADVTGAALDPDSSNNQLVIEAQAVGSVLVNSAADTPDSDPGDGLCDTGSLTPEGATECTLRAAIQTANALGVASAVEFAIPVPAPIEPSSALPAATVPLHFIGGGGGTVIRGTTAPAGASGLRLHAGPSSATGLTVESFGAHGIDYDPVNSTRGLVLHSCHIDSNGGVGIRAGGPLRMQLDAQGQPVPGSSSATGNGLGSGVSTGGIYSENGVQLGQVQVNGNTGFGVFAFQSITLNGATVSGNAGPGVTSLIGAVRALGGPSQISLNAGDGVRAGGLVDAAACTAAPDSAACRGIDAQAPIQVTDNDGAGLFGSGGAVVVGFNEAGAPLSASSNISGNGGGTACFRAAFVSGQPAAVADGCTPAGLVAAFSEVQVSSATINNNGGAGILASTGATLRHCSVNGNAAEGVRVFAGTVTISGTSATTISNNEGHGIRAAAPAPVAPCLGVFDSRCRSVDAAAPVVVQGNAGWGVLSDAGSAVIGYSQGAPISAQSSITGNGQVLSCASANLLGVAVNLTPSVECAGGGVAAVTPAGDDDGGIRLGRADVSGNGGSGALAFGDVEVSGVTVAGNDGPGLQSFNRAVSILDSDVCTGIHTNQGAGILAEGEISVAASAQIDDNAGWGILGNDKELIIDAPLNGACGLSASVSRNGTGENCFAGVLSAQGATMEPASCGGGGIARQDSGFDPFFGDAQLAVRNATVADNASTGVVSPGTVFLEAATVSGNAGPGVVSLNGGIQSGQSGQLVVSNNLGAGLIAGGLTDPDACDTDFACDSVSLQSPVTVAGNGRSGIEARRGRVLVGSSFGLTLAEPSTLSGNGTGTSCFDVPEESDPLEVSSAPCEGGGVASYGEDAGVRVDNTTIADNAGPGVACSSEVALIGATIENNEGHGVHAPLSEVVALNQAVVIRENEGHGIAANQVRLETAATIVDNRGWGVVAADSVDLGFVSGQPLPTVSQFSRNGAGGTCTGADLSGGSVNLVTASCSGGGIFADGALTAHGFQAFENHHDGVRAQALTLSNGRSCRNAGAGANHLGPGTIHVSSTTLDCSNGRGALLTP